MTKYNEFKKKILNIQNWRNRMEISVNRNYGTDDVMKCMEDATDRAVNAQAEKSLFIGEYK